jgi:hypothetical protein
LNHVTPRVGRASATARGFTPRRRSSGAVAVDGPRDYTCSPSRWRAKPALCLLLYSLAACTPPIRQFDLKNQPLTCERANDYALRTLQTQGFTVTAFQPAAVGKPGTLRGTRDERGTQNVTVEITCAATAADIDASEDGKWLGQMEFKRGFYLSFTGIVQAAEISEAARREAALRPQADQGPGLRVLLQPVPGQAAKLDFDFDLAAAAVLPVQVTIANGTPRTYRYDPMDIVLVQADGTRVPPMSIAAAAQRVTEAPRPADAPAPDSNTVTQRLQLRALSGHSVATNQTVKGYVFFPLGRYAKGRVSLEDQATEETEGFVVEF